MIKVEVNINNIKIQNFNNLTHKLNWTCCSAEYGEYTGQNAEIHVTHKDFEEVKLNVPINNLILNKICYLPYIGNWSELRFEKKLHFLLKMC